jgi:hypothetical protein
VKEIHVKKLAQSLFAASLLAPGALAAQVPASVRQQLAEFHREWVAAGKPASASVSPKWGVDDWDVYNVHAYEFQANTSTDLVLDDGNGYRHFGAPSVPYMAAPVRLPAGAHIGTIALSYCSANAGDLVIALYDNLSRGAGQNGGNLIAGPLTSSSGCHFSGLSADYVYDSSDEHPLYLVVFFAGEVWDGSTKFNSASVYYRRLVRVSKIGGRFDDVPATDFGFDYIEALAASGITGGCGGDNYCPDQPVTRRQMAIFIAKALGLHWAD